MSDLKKRSMVVSFIGRPNVGKSSLYNRVVRNAHACMTHDLPGVTRDRHYGIATLNELPNEPETDIILVDTGGFYPEKVEIDESIKRKNNYEPFFNIMADHAKLAIDESDLILFVVDVREGLLPFDKMIVDYIRATKKKMWVLINKYDSDKQMGDEAEFYELGLDFEDYFIVSAEHARGLTTLRERIHEEALHFVQKTLEEEELQKGVTPNFDVIGSVAIIGAPNVGKSTLLNRLVGAERALVSNIAGTTVDPIEGYIDLYFGDDVKHLSRRINQFRKDNLSLIEQYKEHLEKNPDLLGKEGIVNLDEQEEMIELSKDMELLEKYEDLSDEEFFGLEDLEKALDDVDEPLEEEEEVSLEAKEAFEQEQAPLRSIKLVDTAGIRKSKLVKGHIETQSVYRSLRAITESDLVIYMVDATKGVLHQDRRLIDIALEKGKSIVIALNKTDLIPEIMKDDKKKREWLLDLRAQIPWLAYCELITISAKKGTHVKKLMRSIQKTILIRHKKISTSDLNKCVGALLDRHPVVLEKSGGVRFKVKYASMLKASPPTFLMFSNRSKGVPENYRRYLSKGIREEFKLVNTPVHLIFRTRSELSKRIKKSKRPQL